MGSNRHHRIDDQSQVVSHWLDETSRAATPFERRWTQGSLARVDPGLADRLRLQIADFHHAVVTGDFVEVERQGAATCRGWAAAIRVMETAGAPDDAYMVGRDPKTGHTILIGHQRASAERVDEISGKRAVWYSPDELAALVAPKSGYGALSAVKDVFPGAEIVELYPDEPAKGDSEAA